MLPCFFLFSTALLSPVLAKNITVHVGHSYNQFTPLSATAAKGDTVHFIFYTNSHNIIASQGPAKTQVCQPMAGGLHTELRKSGTSYDLPVNATDPSYFFCGPHCQSDGMVFVLNPANASVPTLLQKSALASPMSSWFSMAPHVAAPNATSPAAASATPTNSTVNGAPSNATSSGAAPNNSASRKDSANGEKALAMAQWSSTAVIAAIALASTQL